MKFWNKIPAIIRSLLIGLMIQVIGVIPLFFLVKKNIDIFPGFPWAVIAGGVFLVVFWNYLSGKKLLFPSSLNRVDLSRTKKIDPKAIKLIIISGVCLSISLIAFVFIGYMLAEVPLQQADLIAALKEIPLHSSLSLLFFASLVTGVVEEIAWRGYAQRIIEKKHSAILAIFIIALAFTIIHFLPLAVWPLFILGSLGWGFYAYYSNSILPGIIFHTLIDLTAFVWAMFNLEKLKDILLYNVFEDGINSLFLTLIAVAVLSIILTVFLFMQLKKGKLISLNDSR